MRGPSCPEDQGDGNNPPSVARRQGKANVKLEDQFLRHMLETLTRYASFDLTVEATGTILTTWWRTSP